MVSCTSMGTSILYYDYPLEQGLRQFNIERKLNKNRYYDYPLEQGLRLLPQWCCHSDKQRIMIIH